MGSFMERNSTRGWRTGKLLTQVYCCILIMLSLLQMASAGRPSSSAAGFKAKNVGLKDDFSVLELSLTKATQLKQESKIMSRLELISRRHLNGIGSAPPQCISKCGRCTPCRPIRVPIQPGLVKFAEYYPEAWRCQCNTKLYMP
ncbi:hypothetical protein O6H91_08G010100 [Diphasiastrum complanatum]|uniref:Uncharacterized protein n=1 Tax=Diphasiastrum complanatum TaxID=34168 RepID=A0ACC2CUP7_DIPCM|nr:hypothetical protein O6H91_08G010100 [Diphasiastrum complanatum]